MKWPGWLKRRNEAPPEPAPTDAPRSPVLTTDPRDAGGLTTLCPTYVIHPTSFEDLRHWRQMVAARHPDALLLASLDSLSQAGYTASHALLTHDLDATNGHDLSTLPERCFEDDEHIGYFSTQEEFPIRLANFRSGLEKAQLRDAKLPWLDADHDVTIDEVNFDPDAVVHGPGIVQAVPVERSADMISAFPNGYFSDDLSPFEMHHLTSKLEDLGYQLTALGASYLAFWGDTYLTAPQIAERSTIIAGLYEEADIDLLNDALKGKRHLILRYTA
ncbi:MAG: hypothetical protein OXC60_05265 [Litoreibacter sp.]|nr:hypothetical protein [Litoreibacter sp.]